MRRRDFIQGIVVSTVAWPLASRAQQPAMPVIGFLSLGSQETDAARLTGLRRGLNDTGYVEGQNLVVEYRWAENQTADVGSFLAPKPSGLDRHAGPPSYSRG
jgi:hypothetical protein